MLFQLIHQPEIFVIKCREEHHNHVDSEEEVHNVIYERPSVQPTFIIGLLLMECDVQRSADARKYQEPCDEEVPALLELVLRVEQVLLPIDPLEHSLLLFFLHHHHLLDLLVL